MTTQYQGIKTGTVNSRMLALIASHFLAFRFHRKCRIPFVDIVGGLRRGTYECTVKHAWCVFGHADTNHTQPHPHRYTAAKLT